MFRSRFMPTLFVVAACALVPGYAAQLYVTPDTPADLGAATYKASDIVRGQHTAYALIAALPADARLDGLQRMASGEWLISLESHAVLGGITYDPRDIVRTDGTVFSLFWNGTANGVPAGVNVDAIALVGSDTGPLLLSVDVPARLGALDVEPGDVVRWSAGSYTMQFDASAGKVPLPAATNVVAIDWLATGILLSFDVPTTLAGHTYVPGDVVQWDGTRFTLYRGGGDDGWPVEQQLAGLSTPPAAGTASGLRVTRVGNQLSLRWNGSCSAWAVDYGIYAGLLGNFASHTAIDCSDDGGDRVETVPMPSGHRYYLIVPLVAGAEGSYGTDSNGVERPRGTSPCRPVQGPPSCP